VCLFVPSQASDELVFVIFDGFLALVDPESVRELDVRLFVRESYDALKQRREERSGYVSSAGSEQSAAYSQNLSR